jgi:hypothetical protein
VLCAEKIKGKENKKKNLFSFSPFFFFLPTKRNINYINILPVDKKKE